MYDAPEEGNTWIFDVWVFVFLVTEGKFVVSGKLPISGLERDRAKQPESSGRRSFHIAVLEQALVLVPELVRLD